MRPSAPVLIVLIIGAVALGILNFSLKSLTNAQAFVGCPAQTADGSIDPTQTVAIWQNKPLEPVLTLESQIDQPTQVLGTNTGSKWIEIDLGKQKLIAHDGESVYLESFISSGLWNKTPPGEYNIWYKIRSTKMEGGSKLNKSYYYLPNVPYAMFFFGDYGIHGTYWHSNFGQRMSHGCVNAPTPVAEKLFYWSTPVLPEGKTAVRATPDNPGTRVVVHD